MLIEALQALWLALPITIAGVVHMSIVKRDALPGLRLPLDGGRTLHGRRILGDNKTWRGAVVMVALPGLYGLLQGLAGGPWAERTGAACMDFAAWGAFAGGPPWTHALGYAVANAVIGLGYVAGELPNSFLKRRLGIAPGATPASALGLVTLVIDQADSVLAGLGLGALVFGWSLRFFVVGTVTLTLLHLAFNASMRAARLKRSL